MQGFRNRFHWLSCLFLVFVASACAAGPGGTRSPGEEEGLWVLGSGKASGAPDVARAQLGVRVRSDRVEQATQQANRQMEAVLRALTDVGIAKGDLRTRSLSVHEERHWEPPPRPMGGAGEEGGSSEPTPPSSGDSRTEYVAENMVEVTVRDLERIGGVLEAALSAGANQVHGIELDLDDPSVLVRKAQEHAVKDAQAQAEQLARLAGKRLGRVLAVRVMGGIGRPGPVAMGYAESMDASAVKSVPVQTGELTVFEQVQMRFELQ